MNKKCYSTWLMCLITGGLLSAQTIVGPPADGEENVLSTALASASSGDVLELQEGVYLERNTVETIEGDLTIRGAEGAEVIIYGPLRPEEDADLIWVKSKNLWLDNLIFVGSDSSRNGIVNYYGGVTESGLEKDADKNNIYISNCQFYVFDINHIVALGSTSWDNEIPEAEDDMFHPLDTLRVTDCYFYGANITNDRAIFTGKRQVHYAEVRRSTFWSLGLDAYEVKGYYIGDPDNNNPNNDMEYNTAIADHLTIYNTYNDCPEQKIGRGGDGIHFEYANRTDIVSNSLAFNTGRFCFKVKRALSDEVCATYCIGDSANISGDYSPPTVFYWDMCTANTSFQANPGYVDAEKGDFSLLSNSDAIGTADPNSPSGPNRGDPHWNDSSTYWPDTTEISAIIEKAQSFVSIDDDATPAIVRDFRLDQNYPNPFNPNTTISFHVIERGLVKLEVYTVTGRKVCTLIDETRDVGTHSILWDGLNENGYPLASGVYLYQLEAGSFIKTRKMALVK